MKADIAKKMFNLEDLTKHLKPKVNRLEGAKRFSGNVKGKSDVLIEKKYYKWIKNEMLDV